MRFVLVCLPARELTDGLSVKLSGSLIGCPFACPTIHLWVSVGWDGWWADWLTTDFLLIYVGSWKSAIRPVWVCLLKRILEFLFTSRAVAKARHLSGCFYSCLSFCQVYKSVFRWRGWSVHLAGRNSICWSVCPLTCLHACLPILDCEVVFFCSFVGGSSRSEILSISKDFKIWNQLFRMDTCFGSAWRNQKLLEKQK